MPGDDQQTETAIYAALMAVKPAELSLSAWATRAGVHRSIFNGIRAHGNPTSETLQKLLDAIELGLPDLYAHMPGGDAIVRSEVKGTGMAAHDVDRAWRGPPQQKPVPLLGTAFGGEWLDGVEMTELHLNDALDYLVRPQSVATDLEAYAVEIVGDSMHPRYKPGERAIVSPRAAVRPGDDVIVQLRAPPGEDADPAFAERVTMVLIKELTRRTAKVIELTQYNPPKTFEVPIERLAAIHRVLTRL